MAVAHTPGPWSRVPQTSGGDLIAREYETGKQMQPKGLRLVAFMMARGNSLAEDEANAHLIAAAPLLLKTLQDLEGWLRESGYGENHPWRLSISQAIDAATGSAS